uniref:Mitochondrial ribosomal protein S14 n=1 Tax=Xiphophorus couchianus TaxID=32473 RepID=A0A3B5KRL9_9TELE
MIYPFHFLHILLLVRSIYDLWNVLFIVYKLIICNHEFNTDKEIAALPRDSCPVRIRNRCVFTSRPRGVKRRWRLSRIVFRHLADHNQMSGILRARW